eukprot:1163311-Pyramimonas_sp.AAC.1
MGLQSSIYSSTDTVLMVSEGATCSAMRATSMSRLKYFSHEDFFGASRAWCTLPISTPHASQAMGPCSITPSPVILACLSSRRSRPSCPRLGARTVRCRFG